MRSIQKWMPVQMKRLGLDAMSYLFAAQARVSESQTLAIPILCLALYAVDALIEIYHAQSTHLFHNPVLQHSICPCRTCEQGQKLFTYHQLYHDFISPSTLATSFV